jgi:GYF domain 2
MISARPTAASHAALPALAPSLALAPLAAAADKLLVLVQVTPPALPQPPSAQFFYSENDKPVDPLPLSEIQAKIAAGVIKPDTLVWKAGTPSWIAAKEITEVVALFAAAAPPAPAPTPKRGAVPALGRPLAPALTAQGLG